MCRSASFIVTRTRVLWSLCSDSHEQIIRDNKLDDGPRGGDFVRVEIVPPGGDYSLPISQWEFSTDQDTTPDWYDADEAEAAARAELPVWHRSHVWKVGRGREIKDGMSLVVLSGRTTQSGGVCMAYDNSTVTQNGGKCFANGNSTVTQSGGWCESYDNSTVTQSGGKCFANGNSTVTQSGGVCRAYDHSTVTQSGGECFANGNSTVTQSGGVCKACNGAKIIKVQQ